MINNTKVEEIQPSDFISENNGNTIITLLSSRSQVDKIIYFLVSAGLGYGSLYLLRSGLFFLYTIFTEPPRDTSLFFMLFGIFAVVAGIIGILIIIYSYKWVFKGLETIILSDKNITRNLSPSPLINKSRIFSYESISDIKIRNMESGFNMYSGKVGHTGYFMGNIKGNIWFISEGMACTIGVGLSDENALHVIELINDRKSSLELSA